MDHLKLMYLNMSVFCTVMLVCVCMCVSMYVFNTEKEEKENVTNHKTTCGCVLM